jgi:hypothetical protein
MFLIVDLLGARAGLPKARLCPASCVEGKPWRVSSVTVAESGGCACALLNSQRRAPRVP